MNGSRAKKLLFAVASGLVGRLVAALVPLLIMPSMLDYLGRDIFGVWMTALSITSMALFADLGIGNGLVTRLSACLGKGDLALAQRYVSSAYFLLTVVACVLALLVVLGVSLDLFSGWVSLSGNDYDYAKVVFVTLLAFSIGIPVSLVQRVQYAIQVAWIANAWQILSAIVSISLAKLSMVLGLSAWQVVAVYAFSPLCVLIASTFHCYSFRAANIKPKITMISGVVVGDTVRLGAKFLTLGVLSSVALNADAIIIAKQLGAGAVADFALVAKLSTLLSLIISVAYLPLWPANADAFARGDHEWVRKATVRASLAGALIVGAVGFVLILYVDQLMSLWIGRGIDGQSKLMGMFVAMAVLTAICSPFQMVSNSLGSVRPQMIGWLLYCFSSICLKWIMVGKEGILIIPVISAVAYLIFLMPFSIYGAKTVLMRKSLVSAA